VSHRCSEYPWKAAPKSSIRGGGFVQTDDSLIPFSGRFVNFWMGWWIAIYITLFPVSYYVGYFDGCLVEIFFWIWLFNAYRIFRHNLHVWDARWLLLLLPFILSLAANNIAKTASFNQAFRDLTPEAFNRALIIAGIMKAIAIIIIPLGIFIYVKWFLNKYGNVVEDKRYREASRD
jgi:hypothetical protein